MWDVSLRLTSPDGKRYAEDYFIAMATAAMPWFLIAIYYVFVLLPPEYWNSWEAWKENLLLSRFAAPTSAGISIHYVGCYRTKVQLDL